MSSNASRCQVGSALDIMIGKWKATILLNLLFDGTKRFSELKAAIPDVTPKMLTSHLRELEEQDIVQRFVYAQVPPKVEYSLTEYGRTLAPILEALHTWGFKHVEHMRAKEARENALSTT
jgi:DNA-binding HxlR family transcriptional regulator